MENLFEIISFLISLEIAKLLINYGADIEAKNKEWDRPYDYAKSSECKLLILTFKKIIEFFSEYFSFFLQNKNKHHLFVICF